MKKLDALASEAYLKMKEASAEIGRLKKTVAKHKASVAESFGNAKYAVLADGTEISRTRVSMPERVMSACKFWRY